METEKIIWLPSHFVTLIVSTVIQRQAVLAPAFNAGPDPAQRHMEEPTISGCLQLWESLWVKGRLGKVSDQTPESHACAEGELRSQVHLEDCPESGWCWEFLGQILSGKMHLEAWVSGARPWAGVTAMLLGLKASRCHHCSVARGTGEELAVPLLLRRAYCRRLLEEGALKYQEGAVHKARWLWGKQTPRAFRGRSLEETEWREKLWLKGNTDRNKMSGDEERNRHHPRAQSGWQRPDTAVVIQQVSDKGFQENWETVQQAPATPDKSRWRHFTRHQTMGAKVVEDFHLWCSSP